MLHAQPRTSGGNGHEALLIPNAVSRWSTKAAVLSVKPAAIPSAVDSPNTLRQQLDWRSVVVLS